MQIPFKLLKTFCKNERVFQLNEDLKGKGRGETIVGELLKRGMSRKHISSDIDVVEKETLANSEMDLIISHYVKLDLFGHIHGPDSSQYIDYIKMVCNGLFG